MEAGAATVAQDRSPIAIGLLTLAVLSLYFWLSGALFAEQDAGFWMTSSQTTGMVLTYATTPAFLLAAQAYARRRTAINLDQLSRAGCLSPESIEHARVLDPPIGLGTRIVTTLIGLGLGAANVTWKLVFASLGRPWMFTAFSIAVGNLIVWVVVVRVFHRRFVTSNAIRRLGRDHAEIDLLRLDLVLPFGRIGMLDLLVVVIAISLAAFQSLDAELRWVNYIAALAAGIPAGFILLWLPMFGVHQRIRREKAKALEAIDEAIRHAGRELEPGPLHYLGELLRRRDVVRQAPEWPLDTTGLSRIAIYVVIPPLAWIGGAVVEVLVQRAI